jgi:SAM-dependent methyltransferase
MAKRAQPRAELIGLDADPEVLDRARAKAEAAGVSLQFDQGLSSELHYPDACFDLVVSSLFFHHLRPEDKRSTGEQIARVLKPGGKLHVADWGRPADPPMRILSTQVRLLDGSEPTRDNLSGALPDILEQGGLADSAETGRLRTAFGTLAFYVAERPGSPA